MNLILLHRYANTAKLEQDSPLRFACTSEPVANLIFTAFRQNRLLTGNGDFAIAAPKQWSVKCPRMDHELITYDDKLLLPLKGLKKKGWFVISNGRFVTGIESELLKKLFTSCGSDIIAIDADPQLLAYREKTLLTSDGYVAGFSREYENSILPQTAPTDWPHHIFFKNNIIADICNKGIFPLLFDEFTVRYRDLHISMQTFKIAGRTIDLETQAGLISLMNLAVAKYCDANFFKNIEKRAGRIHDSARLSGKIICGQGVYIGDRATIVGPAVICNDAQVGPLAVIKNSLIGPGIAINAGEFISDSVVLSPRQKETANFANKYNSICFFDGTEESEDGFRYWPKFSYARFGKRLFDIIFSLVVVLLVMPIFLLVAVAVRLNSPGPVFFKDKRQGLFGREFSCLKFRTMMAGADKIQEKLRCKNQVDGPQFKIDDDPRITVIGKFLRETFIDELPQFFNILLGQMSVVGPRPSPRAENLLCPSWRYARLSVRPGITGLWQVCRTRRPGHDFQEWIYYDMEYVKNISLALDLKICCRTAKKLVANFIEHF